MSGAGTSVASWTRRARSWRRPCGCRRAPISSGAVNTRTTCGRANGSRSSCPWCCSSSSCCSTSPMARSSTPRRCCLRVPFGLAGGIYLLYALDYNFSVAVWVGFIALFGTAVQTAVVMVIYLDEAVARKRDELGGRLTHGALLDAVKEGALLRLRPKVMTVSAVVASLLPIMWSHSTGAEVMKPLATPVLGGMVSSLVLVLIVTPVLFYWLRERDLRRGEAEAAQASPPEETLAALGEPERR